MYMCYILGKNASSTVTFANVSTVMTADALIPSLFYADFSKAQRYRVDDHWSGDEEFVVTLTNESGERYLRDYRLLLLF